MLSETEFLVQSFSEKRWWTENATHLADETEAVADRDRRQAKHPARRYRIMRVTKTAEVLQ